MRHTGNDAPPVKVVGTAGPGGGYIGPGGTPTPGAYSKINLPWYDGFSNPDYDNYDLTGPETGQPPPDGFPYEPVWGGGVLYLGHPGEFGTVSLKPFIVYPAQKIEMQIKFTLAGAGTLSLSMSDGLGGFVGIGQDSDFDFQPFRTSGQLTLGGNAMYASAIRAMKWTSPILPVWHDNSYWLRYWRTDAGVNCAFYVTDPTPGGAQPLWAAHIDSPLTGPYTGVNVPLLSAADVARPQLRMDGRFLSNVDFTVDDWYVYQTIDPDIDTSPGGSYDRQ